MADIENSIIPRATDESSEHDLQLRREILGHEAVIHATIREVAPGATIVPTSFSDDEEDVVRHARETGADIVVMAFGDGTAPAGASMIYDRLPLRLHDGHQGLIAASVAVDKDERWIEFLLREEARFHDGAPITAQDVIWTVETLMASGPRRLVAYVFEDVVRAVETGPHTVRFIFEGGRLASPIVVPRIGWMPVLPKHFRKGREDVRTPIMVPPLGSGRYRIAAVEPGGRSVTCELVEDCWARNLEIRGDHPSAERITYRYLSPNAERAEGSREN